ncbi:STAS domain-containing protein [Mycobacterium marseillense]|uniref:Anti-sigma factor antagonist n=1 Tax=Mycobacterium marseillense TaxID=701042 RepID=A0ABM7JEE5_9MYCO|nr:STAS domain-containing protein [Mycobacterium marseillense]OBJ76139.1 anti-anti-sigma factor [Mycobacterium marseillense]ORA89151.1 anti-anti-sigma factor [Mycobacterium marseillense]BBY12274.1 anti-sigma factor antagonist [Mycobacterium marseillense]
MAAAKGTNLLAVEYEAHEDAIVVRVKGAVDSRTVGELAAHLATAVEQAATQPARPVIIDLQNVDFFGSAALNAVLDCHESGAARGTPVRLVADDDQVLRPIQVTELDRVFDIYPTLSDALQRGRQR